MALERFIPKSPDTNIRNTQDFEIAKFGHLNTVVEYINNNAVQPAGLNGYVQFNNNGALGGDAGLFWDNVNKRLGIGTSPNSFGLLALNGTLNMSKLNIVITKLNQTDPTTFPIQKQDTVSIGTFYTPTANPLQTGDANTFVGMNTAMGDDNSYFNTMIGYAASITAVEPKNVVIGAQATSGSAEVVAIGHLASSSASAGIAIGAQASVTASQGVAIGRLATTSTANGFALGNALAKLQIGGNFIPTARIHVRGLGSTSATTSLLVQNSAGTAALTIKDDLNVSIPTWLGVGGATAQSGAGEKLIVNGAQIINGPAASSTFMIFQVTASNKIIFGMEAAIGGSVNNAMTYVYGNNSHVLYTNNIERITTTGGGNVLIGTTTDVASSLMTLASTTKGFLPPRMTDAQIRAILTPAEGLVAYNTTISHLCVYQAGAWAKLSHSPM